MIRFYKSRRNIFSICLFLIFVAIIIRSLLFLKFPIMLTADSWDYMGISEDIYNYARFSHYSLGEWRLPVYPLFLVFIQLFGALDAVNIVLAQSLLGVGIVILGMLIGWMSRSYTLVIIMGLFLSLNPVYLLYEHLVMTELLFLFTLLGFTLIAFFCIKNELGWGAGFLLGISASLCMLTRANGLFFCLPMIVFVVWLKIPLKSPRQIYAHMIDSRVHYLLGGIMVGFLLIFTPWLWRNYEVYSHFSLFTHNTNLNMVAYLAEHDLIDTSLPIIRTQNENNSFNSDYSGTIYKLIWELRSKGIVNAEQLANMILREQLSDHPEAFLSEVGYSALNFGGYPILPIEHWNARIDMKKWFEKLVYEDVGWIHKGNQDFYDESSGTYIDSRTNNAVIYYLAWAGRFYLEIFRPILFTIFVFSFALSLIFFRYFMNANSVIIPLGLSYLAVVFAHALTLSDYDRFSTPFDWIPLLVICLIIKEFFTYRRCTEYRQSKI